MAVSRSTSVHLTLLPVLLVVGCQRTPEAATVPLAPPSPPPFRFAILDEGGRPILTEDQIVGYEWATHSITLQPGATVDVQVKQGEGHSLVRGIPFAVVADGVTCYRGAVTTSLSSCSQAVPVIDIHPIGNKEGVVRIELGYPSREYFKGDDPREDERIRQTLRSLGKLRE